MEAAQQQTEIPKIIRMPVNPAQVQSIGVGGVQFNTATILQSPFFWLSLGVAGAFLAMYAINRQKYK